MKTESEKEFMKDAELVERAQNGDVAAVGALYDHHQPHIYRYVWLRVRHNRRAEDLTSEIFTRMVKNLPTYRTTDTPFRAWLYRIAHNLIVDFFRKQDGRVTVPLYYAESVRESMNNPHSIVEKKLSMERVDQALDQIDPSQREVVVLRFLVGLSLKEVAHTLDKSVAAVKSLQHRGLAALRIALQQEASL